jgi:hypothetical protein
MHRFTSKRTYSIVFISVLFLLLISFYSNKDFYKQYIIDKIYTTIDFKIVFEDSSLIVFPAPGINLKSVSIHSISEENKFDVKINSMKFLFSWKILFGVIELNKIHVSDGIIVLSAINTSENKEPDLKPKLFNAKSLQKIFTFLNMDTISFQSVQFIAERNDSLKEDFYCNFLEINNDHISLISINLDISYQAGHFQSESKIQYINNDYNFNSLQIESKWKFNNAALKPLKEYYSLVYGANFDNTNLNGEISLFKEKYKNEFNIKTDITIVGLHFLGAPVYPNINANSEFTFLPDSKQINFSSIRLYYENGAIASANGTLTYNNDIFLNLNIKGEYADIYKVVYLIVRAVDFKISSSMNFYSRMNIICAKATFDLYEIRNINLDLKVTNAVVELKINNADVLHGHLVGTGKIIASSHSNFQFDVSLKDINSQDLIGKYTKSPYLKGALSANLTFTSSGNTFPIFLDNLHSKGKVEIKKGELLGYANILKPIFSLGKLINFLGPRGKNTEFQSLNLDYSIQNRLITIPTLKMVGVGLDAHGSGNISFDRKIDFRIYAGLGGIAGKALYIPILYKGIMPDNVSYIDPVWIGSVYVGATLFGGPAGATVGGITGSAVSEYVNKAWEGIKGIFSRD